MTRKIVAAFVTLLCAGCSDGGDENPLDPGPGAFDPDFETSQAFFTQMSEPAVGLEDASPHGVVQIWYSINLQPATEMDTFEASEGSVAIKTQQYEDGAYTEILVMIKEAEETTPSRNDWRFEVRTAEGELVGPSDPDFCADCHNAFSDHGGLAGIGVSN
jgi:hypothetical protein